ncbi:hypothetical protein RN607_13555 [Demequina capsici]|uniref:Uncharacterized protein n=1 Tax=Demequina capsici TaxID=3075620 RepID=A0AA96JCR8_9MICO|nr:hypothetical protein [Demequina sp. PMTSA13]WNM27211.1 hypothetical protein RN607_13555 [Demequina sp. PMTSA13]
MDRRDAEVISELRLRLETQARALGVEVEFEVREERAAGAASMPSLHCRTPGVAATVELYVEDAVLAWIEVRGVEWMHSDLADYRLDWLGSEEGVRWLGDLVSGRWTVERRPRFLGFRRLRTSGGGPSLRVTRTSG